MRKVSKGNASHLKVELYYTLGGMNYFTGINEARGIYLSVCPITKTETSTIYRGFSGGKICVKEMTRFNQKVFDNFEVDNDTMIKLIAHVICENNLELEPLSKE